MSNFAILNKTAHKDTKVITDRSADLGDKVKFVMTFPLEFRNVQSNYPIFFIKDGDTGQFYPIALFGFEKDENLFLSDAGWDASYIPMMVKRQPFLIGFQGDADTPDAQKMPWCLLIWTTPE